MKTIHICMKKITIPIQLRFSEDVVKRIDTLVEKERYDSRTNFIRRATIEKLQKEEQVINA